MKFSGFNTTEKIGIGTNDPGRPLHVRGAGNSSVVRVGDGDTDGAAAIAYIEFGANSTSWNRHSYVGSAGADSHLWIVNEENADILFYANNAEKMVIKNDGNVGINTTAPSAILHIRSSGTARNVFYVAASDNGHLAGIYEESDGRGALNVRNAGGTATINLDSGGNSYFTGGNFGIGTTTPGTYTGVAANLEVKTSGHGGIAINSGAGSLGMLAFVQNNSHKWSLECQNDATPNMSFNEAGTLRMVIAAGGQLKLNSYGSGTHTGTSAYKLSVDSSGNIIETSIGSGAVDGAGTANYISKWTDGDTIGNSIVYNHAYGVIINATSTSSYATNRQVFEVRGTAGTGAFDGGITNLTASSNTNTHRVGQLAFINTANANHVNPNAAAGSRIAQIISTVVTSDSNAGDDSGGDLQFWTKPEAGVPAERMRISSAGLFGIGSDPMANSRLRIHGETYPLRVATGSTEYYFAANVLYANSTNGMYLVNQSQYLRFGASNAEIMRLIGTGNGSVCIGTTTAGGVSKLEVQRPARTTAFNAGDGDTWHDVIVRNPTNSSNAASGITFVMNNTYHKNAGAGIAAISGGSDYMASLAFITRPNGAVAVERMRIQHDGNVGIGSTAPGHPLVVVTPTGDKGISLTNSSNVELIHMRQEAGDSGAIGLKDGGNVQVWLTSRPSSNSYFNVSGANFGIGTNSPAAKLDIAFPDNTSIWRGSYASSEDNFYLELDTFIPSGGVVAYSFDLKNNGTAYNNNLVLDRGKVGIGTTAPGTLLHLRQYDTTGPTITMSNNPKTGYINWWGAAGGSGDRINEFEVNAGAAGYGATIAGKTYVRFKTDGVGANDERMRIASDGNVGIGTTSPAHALHVYDTTGNASAVLIDGSASNSGFLSFRQAGVEKSYIQYTANSYLRYFAAGGHNFAQSVGIGTNTLYAGTNVTSLTINATSYPTISLNIGGTVSHVIMGYSTYLNIDAIGNRSIKLRTNDLDRLTISGDGAITAQTDQNNSTIFKVKNATASTSSDAQLRCESSSSLGLITAMPSSYSTSSAYVADSFLVLAASTCSAGLGLAAEGANPINLWTNNTKRVTVDSAGNVGIGTTAPAAPFHVHKDSSTAVRLVRGATDGQVIQFYRGSSISGNIQVRSSGLAIGGGSSEDDIFIDTAGKVGINDITPSYQLDVNGTFRSTGAAYFNGAAYTTGQAYNGGLRIGGAGGSSYAFAGERLFTIPAFPNGVANQKVDLYWTAAFWGYMEIEITGSYTYQNMTGVLTKSFTLGLNTSNSIVHNESWYSNVGGLTAGNFAISDVTWDATNSRYRIQIVHRTSTGNTVRLKLRCLGDSAAITDTFMSGTSVSAIYTTDTTAFDMPVKQLAAPNDNAWVDGYLGIGTTSPTTNLHIKPASGNARLKLESDLNTADVEMMLDSAGTTRNAHITFYTNGTQRGGVGYVASDTIMKMWGDNNPADDHLCINSAGNVGIGTASPGKKLHVYSGASGIGASSDVNMILEGASNVGLAMLAPNNQGSRIEFGSVADNNEGIIYYNNTGSYFSIYTNGTRQVDITSAGNVGIGQTAPRNPLEVDLNQSNGTLVGDSAVHFGGQHHSSGQIMGLTLGYREANDSYRKVGIVAAGLGDNAARQDFHILVNTANSAASCSLADSKLSIYGTTGIVRVHNKFGIGGDPGTHHLYAAGTACILGSVGIGTTATPESLLHVRAYAGGNYTGEARIGGVNTTHGMLLSYTQLGATEGSIHVAPGYANSSALFKLRCSTNNTNQLVLKGNGHVGIGTAGPSYRLSVFNTTASDNKTIAHFEGQGIGGSTDAGGQYISVNRTGPISQANGVMGGIIFGRSVPTGSCSIIRNNYKYTAGRNLEFLTSADNSADPVLRMTIKGDGNVGINQTSPSAKLDIVESASYTPPLELNAPHAIVKMVGGNGTGYMGMGNGYFGSQPSGMFFRSDNLPICWGAAGSSSTHMTLLANGKFGIGTTNPTRTLQVAGAAHATSHLVGSLETALGIAGSFPDANDSELGPGYLVMTRDDTAAAKQLQFWKNGSLHSGVMTDTNGLNFVGSDGAADVTIKTDGDVGIGTATPSQKLMVWEGSSSVSFGEFSNGAVIWLDGVNGDLSGGDYFNILADSSTALRFGFGTANKVSMLSNGNVGIGTTSPSATLHVRDTSTSTSRWTAAFVADNASAVSAQSHDHVLIQSNDVPSLKFYEYGQDQVGGIAVGDNNTTLSTTEAMRFYVNGSATGPLHDGLNGTCALKLQTNGTSDFYGNVNIANNKILSVGTGASNSSGKVRLYGGSGTAYYMDYQPVGTQDRNFRFNGSSSGSAYTTYFNQQGSGNHNVYVDGDITSAGTGRYIYAVNLNVTGYKNFEIEHPTKEKMMLVHSSLEGPEAGVYHRGRVQSDTITMPDYWSGLVREDTITVQLTPNGSFQHLYVVSTSLSEIKIGAAEGETIDCYYIIYGERADVAPLVVEDAAAWERFQERKSAMSDGKA